MTNSFDIHKAGKTNDQRRNRDKDLGYMKD